MQSRTKVGEVAPFPPLPGQPYPPSRNHPRWKEIYKLHDEWIMKYWPFRSEQKKDRIPVMKLAGFSTWCAPAANFDRMVWGGRIAGIFFLADDYVDSGGMVERIPGFKQAATGLGPLHPEDRAELCHDIVFRAIKATSHPRTFEQLVKCILGNIFQLPKFQWYKFTEWKIQYGPIFSLNLAGQPVVVLNTHKVAADLLNRRSHIYSDRPRFIMAGEILTGGMLIAFMPYADPWRRMRKASHEGLSVRASEKFKYIQEKEATRLIFHLLRDPDNWDTHLKRSSASVILSSIYGWKPIEPEDDPLVERINGLMHRLVRAALPGAYLVEIFPVMKWFPSWVAKWKREGLGWYRKDTEMFRGFLADVKKEKDTGNCKPCFSSLLLDNQTKFNLTNDESSWLAGTMFGAGAETTAAALSVFMLAMVSYPDVMRRAQSEIDRVVGCDRPPNFGDHDSLPYIRAMVKEVLRWRPVGPLGLPRRTVESDWYEGYYIPKGALVIYNTWAMNRDPILFPDYDEFRPDRFLDSSGQIDQTPPDTLSMGHVTYGFGKRICLGMNMANQSLFIDIAYILWALNIEQATDGQGNFIIPSKTDCVDEGLVVRPVPFKCKITARSGDAMAVLESTRADEIN